MPDLFNELPVIPDPHGPCPCGSTESTLHKGTGPHAAGLRCANCGRFRGWLSKAEYAELNKTPALETMPKRPDLQELVAQHGTYSQITPEAWIEWDRAIKEWETRRRDKLLDRVSRETKSG